MAKNHAQIADQWAQRMGSADAQNNYKNGVANPRVNPMQAAASPEALSRYQQGTANAVNSGKMASALQAVSQQQWTQQCQQFGAGKLGAGAQKGKSKYASYVQRAIPVWAQMRAAADALPKGGLANAQARAAAALAVQMQAFGKA